MASTYSPSLRLELIGNGEQSGTWGTTTNTNLGTLIEQAISGVETITMANAPYTLTSFNGASDEARNAVLVVQGTNSAVQNVIAPAEQKTYIIYNNTVGGYSIRIKTSVSAGVLIPSGGVGLVYCDGSEFFLATAPQVTANVPNTAVFRDGSGNFAAGTITANLVGDVTGGLLGTPTAPTAAPGTNTTQIATTAFVQNIAGGLGTMSTQNAAAVAITGGTLTGITDLTVADGGTGVSTLAANAVVLGNGTSPVQTVAPGTSGNVLTSNGTTWQSTAGPTGITPSTGSAPYYGMRAWAVIDRQTSSYVILAGAGIASVTYNSDSEATVNISVANQPASADYGILVTCASPNASQGQRYGNVTARTTTSFSIKFSDDSSVNPVDQFTVSVIY